VEGRLKGPAYVASVASNYRDVLDGSPGDLKQRTLEMAQTYSRGFFSGWLHGVDHQNLVDGYYGDNRGPVIGKIQKVERDKVVISSELSLAPGQGVLFASEGNQGVGSKIYQVEKRKQELILGIDKSVSLKKIKVGDQVYLNSSPELNRQLEKSYTDLKRQKRIPIEMLLTLKEGQLASLKAFDQRGNSVEVLGEAPLEAARKAPRLELIRDELSSLSRTAFSCPNPEVNLVGGDVFIQQKAVKKLRQKMLELLVAKRVEVPNYSANEFEINSACDFPPADNPQLNLVLRQKEQVDELIANLNQLGETSLATLGVAYLDFEFGQHYRPSVEALKAAGVKVGLTTNRILKPGEYHHLKNIIKLGPDVYLVRNLGAAKFLTDAGIVAPLKGDFSLNVANSLSADYLFDRGFETLTLSYDLNQKQLYDLIKHSKSRNFEITIHQYMPSFHMEHCVFAAFLSQGHSYKDCGKPCEKHKMELIDQFGNSHFIKADSECRNTMFNGQAQSGSFLVKDLIQMGVSEFRLEFLFERGEELTRKLTSYLALISGEIELSELVKNFHTLEKYGFGSGQVLKSDRYKNRKKR
jgi:putative protease